MTHEDANRGMALHVPHTGGPIATRRSEIVAKGTEFHIPNCKLVAQINYETRTRKQRPLSDGVVTGTRDQILVVDGDAGGVNGT